MVINAFLVEDRADIRETLIEAMEEVAPLKFVGHATTEASAKDWLQTHQTHWDLVIVDLSLSEGNGYGVLQNCQQRRPQQKVIVLTAHQSSAIKNRCIELGADKVFDKSQDVEQLVAFCRAHASELNSVFDSSA